MKAQRRNGRAYGFPMHSPHTWYLHLNGSPLDAEAHPIYDEHLLNEFETPSLINTMKNIMLALALTPHYPCTFLVTI